MKVESQVSARNNRASRMQSQTCLNYAEAQPIICEANNRASRMQSQTCLSFAEAQPISGEANLQCYGVRYEDTLLPAVVGMTKGEVQSSLICVFIACGKSLYCFDYNKEVKPWSPVRYIPKVVLYAAFHLP